MAQRNFNLWAANIKQNKTKSPPKCSRTFLCHTSFHSTVSYFSRKTWHTCTTDSVLTGCWCCWNTHLLRLASLQTYVHAKSQHTPTTIIFEQENLAYMHRTDHQRRDKDSVLTGCWWCRRLWRPPHASDLPINNQFSPALYCLVTSGSARVGFVA